MFTVQKDKDDFIDSLARIVRDLDFDEDGVIPELRPSTAAKAPPSEASKKSAATSTQTATTAPATSRPATTAPATTKQPAPAAPSKKGESPSKESSGAVSQQEGDGNRSHSNWILELPHDISWAESIILWPIAQRNEIIDRKKEAIAAVAAAKKDLLRHSLDMMVCPSHWSFIRGLNGTPSSFRWSKIWRVLHRRIDWSKGTLKEMPWWMLPLRRMLQTEMWMSFSTPFTFLRTTPRRSWRTWCGSPTPRVTASVSIRYWHQEDVMVLNSHFKSF